MNLHKQNRATLFLANIIRYFNVVILITILLIFIGCAAAPKILTIKHENSPSQGNVISPQMIQKEPIVQNTDAPADQLQNKNAASGVQTALVTAQSERPVQKEPVDQSAAAPVDQIKSTNAASGAQTALVSAQSETQMTTEKNAGIVSDASDNKERIEKTAPMSTEDLKKSLQDQVKSEITASVTEELSSIGEQVKSEVQNEMLREIWAVKQDVKSLEEQVKSEVHNEMLREMWTVKQAMAVPEWTRRFKFSGDLRLRYEHDFFDKNNAAPVYDWSKMVDPSKQDTVPPELNTTIDQARYKYRVRFGVEAKVNETVDAILRLSTGSTSNPVSTNSIMGDYMNKDSILFDQAYIKWRPGKDLTLFGGRMANPWFSTDLVWDTDLNFEGLALQVNHPVSDTVTPFLTIGAFPLQQNDFTQHGKWLNAGQVGVERRNQKGISAKIGVAYYDFENITGIANDPLDPFERYNWTAPLFMQKGNTLFNISAHQNGNLPALASEFKELNATGTLDIGLWDPVHIIFLADYVKNLGFKKADVYQRTGDTNTPVNIEGYQIGMSVGYPSIQDAGQWKAYFYKKYLGNDAVVDAFTDSDFHLGGTNAKGWILGSDIGLAKNFWLALRWMTANEISGPPLAIDVLQVDLNAKF
jgi:hypothetical protein